MSHIQDRVIAITGAASGFGRLVACKAAAMGAKVACADVQEAELANTLAMIEDAGGEAIAVTADVTQLPDMQSLVATCVETFGRLDVMVNNAGTMPLAFFSDHEQAMEAWNRCIDINFKGVLNGMVAVYDHMIEQGRGQVVNMSSIYGNYPLKGAAVYGATKAAVVFLSESLRQESLGRIKVTTVKPTGIPTTGIAGAVVNFEAGGSIVGANNETFGERFGQIMEGTAPAEWSDADNIQNFMLEPELLADQVIYAIDQPWGVSISEVTVRASGDMYVI